MRIHRRNRPRAVTLAVFLFGLLLAAQALTWAQTSPPPVVSLKKFIDEPVWQLDVTWHGKDAYADADRTAKIEFTATARFILKQLDKKDAWGRWQALRVKSSNLVFSGSLVDSQGRWRLDYKNTAEPVVNAAAVLQVGGNTPGYQLNGQIVFPVLGTGTPSGTSPTMLVLPLQELGKPTPSGTCSGPLPTDGTPIHGSLTIPLPLPPFVAPVPMTRVGIQVVLQPLVELAPLVPLIKR